MGPWVFCRGRAFLTLNITLTYHRSGAVLALLSLIGWWVFFVLKCENQ